MACRVTRLSQGLLIHNWHKSLVFFPKSKKFSLFLQADPTLSGFVSHFLTFYQVRNWDRKVIHKQAHSKSMQGRNTSQELWASYHWKLGNKQTIGSYFWLDCALDIQQLSNKKTHGKKYTFIFSAFVLIGKNTHTKKAGPLSLFFNSWKGYFYSYHKTKLLESKRKKSKMWTVLCYYQEGQAPPWTA